MIVSLSKFEKISKIQIQISNDFLKFLIIMALN